MKALGKKVAGRKKPIDEYWIHSHHEWPAAPPVQALDEERGRRRWKQLQNNSETEKWGEWGDKDLGNGLLYNTDAVEGIRKLYIKKKIHEQGSSFTEYTDTVVVCGTFNVNGQKDTLADLSSWLGWSTDPDIFAIGFQEIVELNAVHVVVSQSKSQQRAATWKRALERYLTTLHSEYCFVKHQLLVGVVLYVFVKAKHEKYVQEVQSCVAMTGFGGNLGNKGGVGLRMQFYDTTMCFICSHLAAQRQNVVQREADFRSIIEKASFRGDPETAFSWELRDFSEEFNSNYDECTIGILDHDIIFWLGDLNYRINVSIPIDEVLTKAKTKSGREIAYLLTQDQLIQEKQRKGLTSAFGGFKEGKITFLPTFKYQVGTDSYDERPDKKIRAPAWCDRVLWRSLDASHVKLLSYHRAELNVSDHKPVAAVFRTKTRKTHKSQHRSTFHNVISEIKQLDAQGGSSKPEIKLGAHKVSFGTVRCMEPTQRILRVANIGRTLAYLRFTPQMQGLKAFPKWLSVSPSCCLLEPGYTQNFSFTAEIDGHIAAKVFAGEVQLEQLLVLRLEDGPEYYIDVFARLAYTALAMPLSMLVNRQGKSRSMLGIPMELYLLINGIISTGVLDDPTAANELFTKASSRCQEEVEKVVEWLGAERDFDFKTRTATSWPPLPNVSPWALAVGILELFRKFPKPIVLPVLLLGLNFTEASGRNVPPELLRHFCSSLPPINCNVFLYFTCFLSNTGTLRNLHRTAMKQVASNAASSDCHEIHANKLAEPCCGSICFGGEAEREAQDIMKDIIMRIIIS